ncbi:MAG: hypothetical protein WCO00_10545, partial [Rhodospirillaceae bacterium]
MSNIVLYNQADMSNPYIWYGSVDVATSSQISISYGSEQTIYYGSFSYNAYEQVFGTLTRIDVLSNGALSWQWTGSANANVVYNYVQVNSDAIGVVSYLTSGNDVIVGSKYGDVLKGGAGNDTITGTGSQDVFIYDPTGNGVDTINGFVSSDIIRVNGADIYSVTATASGGYTVLSISTNASSLPITVNLTGTFYQDQFSFSATDITITDHHFNASPTGTVSIAGSPIQGQTLVAGNTLADADGLGPIGYRWQASVNGSSAWTAIDGATDSTLTLTTALIGRYVRVEAYYTDGWGTAETKDSTAVAVKAHVNALPSGSVSITGSPIQGQTLVAGNTLADADGLGDVGYRWQASANGSSAWTTIDGATDSTLTLTTALIGQYLRVEAYYTDGWGTAETRDSTAVAVKARVNALPTGTVTITGSASEG